MIASIIEPASEKEVECLVDWLTDFFEGGGGVFDSTLCPSQKEPNPSKSSYNFRKGKTQNENVRSHTFGLAGEL